MITTVPRLPGGRTTTGERLARLGRAAPIVVVTTIALVLDTWRLDLNTSGNGYYTAAARSMSLSWHNWFFAAFDPGGFISVDKPPVPLWITAISVRVFGFSSWSVLLPAALAGAAAVALLFLTVRRRFGTIAATVAGLVLAVTPVSVAVNRLNLPEPWMLLFLIGAVASVERAALQEGRRRTAWIAFGGALVGLAFNTKMLAAFIPLPAIGLGVLLQSGTWRRRLVDGITFGVTTLVVSASWLVVVDAIPASSRPYVGGSTDNTVLDLVLGYNGLGRVNGSGGGFGGGGFGGGAMSGAGGVMGGTASSTRLLSEALGGQIAWLLPLAVFGALVAAWLHRRDADRRSSVVVWAGWVLLYGVVFSLAQGTFHAYYTSAMAPGVAAVIGIGVAAVVAQVRADTRWILAVPVSAAATLALEWRLAGRFPHFYGWVRGPAAILVGAGLVTGVALVAWSHRTSSVDTADVHAYPDGDAGRSSRRVWGAGAVVLAGLLTAPAAWALSETANPVLNATLPQAGPRSGMASSTFGSASWKGDAALAAFLRSVHGIETWDLVVGNAQEASGLTADDGIPVLAIGGFMGTDRSTSIAAMADRVAAGSVRLFLVGTSGFSGRGGGAPGAGGVSSRILSAVASACAPVGTKLDGQAVPRVSSGRLYDCAGAADRLRLAG